MIYDELIKRLRETSIDFGESDHVSVMLIEAADAIEELQKRKHGKWVYIFHKDDVSVTCSECGMYEESFAKWIYDDGYRVVYNYCPYCGAEMESADYV